MEIIFCLVFWAIFIFIVYYCISALFEVIGSIIKSFFYNTKNSLRKSNNSNFSSTNSSSSSLTISNCDSSSSTSSETNSSTPSVKSNYSLNTSSSNYSSTSSSISSNYTSSSYTPTKSFSSSSKSSSYNKNNSSEKRYYAYGTYAENGKLYNMEGKEIKNSKKYYEKCRKNKEKSGGRTYSSKGFVYEYKENNKKYNYYKKK